MDGTKCGRRPPPEVRREFTMSRMEIQVLTQAYELIVPVVRRPVSVARTCRDVVNEWPVEAATRRMAQGA